MARKPHLPQYRHHKASGQAVVTLSGRDYYLGPYDSPESHAEYQRLLAEWLAAGRMIRPPATPDLTVNEILNTYFAWAKQYYRKNGKETSQVEIIRYALIHVRELYGETLVTRFGPLALEAVRQRMIEANWCRRYINNSIACIKRTFSWAVSKELIPPSVSHALATVKGLERGRSAARESKRVLPADEAAIEVVRGKVLPVVRDMIDLQLLTGARPGEITSMQPGEIDRSRKVWIYKPGSHKTEHHGSERIIPLGPRAQVILAPYLLRGATSFCFSPREAMLTRLRKDEQRLKLRKERTPGERYTPCSYSQAIRQGCIKAALPSEKWWHPHQLRHNAATRIRAEFGPEVARAVLGHRSLQATEIYAEIDLKAAIDAMEKTG